MKYKDEDGNLMYGYSQRSLDKNTFWIKALFFIVLILLLYGVYALWHISRLLR